MMIGETKLGYTITELVGQGGFGTVYKAVKKNKALETVRALKHISLPSRKEWTDIYNSMGNDMARTDAYFDTILQEILNEIRILADLTNKGVKNVVWYYENEIEDTPSPKHYDIYLLMEFLTPFTSYIETHQVKVKDVLQVGIDILTALVECHKRKIIHRDIKTDNIFISEDGDYKLGDFGVSKKLSDRSRATSMKGTPNYIAPEVYLGQEYDETVDLYSLGIVLYRLLNYNRNPFMPEYPTSYNSEDEDKAFECRMKGDVPSYPAFASGELGDIILKSISNKDNRYKSAAEFKEALENVKNSLSQAELDTIVLENQLSGVDFSTFGSKSEMTQMANNSQQSFANNSFQNYQTNQFSMNSQNGFNNTNFNNTNINNVSNQNKKKINVIPIVVVLLILILGAGGFFVLNNTKNSGNKGNNGKFVQENGITKFKKKDGAYAQNEWVFFEDNEYYFNGRQSLVTNDTIDFNGKTYYVDGDGAKIFNDWYKKSNGEEYYLDENGEVFKNTAKDINGTIFFFDAKGKKIVNDWGLYDGDYYYLDENGKMLKDTFKQVGATWYYLGSDGKMLKSTFYDDAGQTYYFDENGSMKENTLVQVGDSIYFAEADGSIKKGGWCANNQYYAGDDGKILMNTTTPDGVKVDSTGKRIQSTPVYSGGTQPTQPLKSGGTQPTTTSSYSGTPSIKADSVVWGDHIKYTEQVFLDEYGENGKGKITINVTKLKEDGSAEVTNVNEVLEKIYNESLERAQYELPYKYFELEKTALSSCTENQLVIVVTGEIKHMDDTKDNMRYKLILDRGHGTVTYEKVR